MLIERILIIKADGAVHLRKPNPRKNFAADEVGFRIAITLPQTWGQCIGNVELTVPELPEATVLVEPTPLLPTEERPEII